MPARAIAAKELADFLGAVSHPQRIRIIEELRDHEMDVNSLQAILNVSHSRVSQHLAVLRTHRVVAERRDGRHVFYHLLDPRLAGWLAAGLEFIAREAQARADLGDALEKTRELWSQPASPKLS